jgi:arylsulfatase A-like enzyme
VLSWPGRIAAGSVCETPLHITDWMPTFCSLAGYQANSDLKWDGSDVWEAISGRSPLPERSIYSVTPGFRAHVLRSGQWKLVVTNNQKQNEKFELFDIAKDPNERQNLAAANPQKVAEMRAKLTASMARDLDAVVPTSAKK